MNRENRAAARTRARPDRGQNHRLTEERKALLFLFFQQEIAFTERRTVVSPNGGDRSSSHYKPFTPTSSKVSNVRRKKFAPLIAGVADNVPLDELLEKYPNFADCLGPKKYDSGHFIRLYSDLVRCDRLGDAIDLLQRLSDAKVPCLNDTRIRKHGRWISWCRAVAAIEQVEQLAGDARVYVYEFGFGSCERSYRTQKLRRYITSSWRCALRTETARRPQRRLSK